MLEEPFGQIKQACLVVHGQDRCDGSISQELEEQRQRYDQMLSDIPVFWPFVEVILDKKPREVRCPQQTPDRLVNQSSL